MGISSILAWAAGLYVVAIFAISLWASKKIENTEDYLVAGRRLPLSLAWATIFATWFGAGTLLTATDEVRAEGLRKGALDPFGAGICLVIAGLLFARPLWKMNLLTLPDFFQRRFGKRAELVSAVVMVPGFIGWTAAQFVALAGMMELFFGLPMAIGVLAVAVVGTAYTLVGGMWSVTLTDALQMVILILGVLLLGYITFDALGGGSLSGGWARLLTETDTNMLTVIPRESAHEFLLWLGVLCAGALGNIPSQDLTQRIFASRSANTARAACVVAGVAYIAVGLVPLLTGLAGSVLFPHAGQGSILAVLARALLSPAFAVLFLLAVMSAVLSTIDSAILSVSSVLSQNILSRIPQRRLQGLGLNKLSVIVIGVASLLLAYAGESAYSLLETAYEMGLVALFVPLSLGLFSKWGGERAALASMVVGTVAWVLHLLLGWEFFCGPSLAAILPLPMGLSCAALGTVCYGVLAWGDLVRAPPLSAESS